MESVERKEAIAKLKENMTEENLWEAVIAFQDSPFFTATGLPYTYQIKRGRSGDYNRELIVSRQKESKSLVWSSVRKAFNSAIEMKGTEVPRPKALGDIRGISYIYPLLYTFGVIEVPEKVAACMVK